MSGRSRARATPVPSVIRPEAPADQAAISEVVTTAFGRENEARLVELIRASDRYVAELSLVAEQDDVIVGHAMFSYVILRSAEDVEVIALAPVSVAPAWQSKGVGGALIREGIARCDARGEPLVHVLGHPAYYPRFGFERSRPYGIEPADERTPDGATMVIKLSAYEERYRGRIVYPPAFDVT